MQVSKKELGRTGVGFFWGGGGGEVQGGGDEKV